MFPTGQVAFFHMYVPHLSYAWKCRHSTWIIKPYKWDTRLIWFTGNGRSYYLSWLAVRRRVWRENETIHDTLSLRDLLAQLSPQLVVVPGWTWCPKALLGVPLVSGSWSWGLKCTIRHRARFGETSVISAFIHNTQRRRAKGKNGTSHSDLSLARDLLSRCCYFKPLGRYEQ